MAKMIGKNGETQCQQLRGLLHAQKVKLQEEESKKSRDEAEIQKIQVAIETTHKKLKENDC